MDQDTKVKRAHRTDFWAVEPCLGTELVCGCWAVRGSSKFSRLGGSFVEGFLLGEMFGLVKLAFLCLPRFLACQCHVSGGSLFPDFRECSLLSPHTVIAWCDCRAGLIPMRGEPGRRDKWEVGVRPEKPCRVLCSGLFLRLIQFGSDFPGDL